jgi:hypothetical protein
VEEYCRAGHATDDSVAHAGYLRLQTHTLRLCNTHCFSAVTIIAGTRLNVALYVHWLSCLTSQKQAVYNTFILKHVFQVLYSLDRACLN